MEFIKTFYWITTAILWVLIAANFWSIFRNYRCRKEWEKMCETLELLIADYKVAIAGLREEDSDEGND